MTEEIKHKKRKFLFNPLKRPLPYIGLIIAFVLIIFQQTIRNYVSDTIGDILINSMKEATGGVYKTTYDLVRFDIISKELRISNLEIELDTTVISREDYLLSRPNLLHINTPLIVVKLRSITPLLFNNQLYVSYIGAINPQFSLVKSLHISAEKEPSKASKKNLRDAINTYFAALEVDSFRVEKGSFKISTHAENEEELSIINIGEFTTMLKNFRLDSLSPSILLKGMRAQSFDLEIYNQHVNLPEINQTVHFDKLSLSTTDSTFILDSLKIVNIINDDTRNVSDLSISKLEILGFNFEHAFSNNGLLINEIRINEPNLIFKKNNFSAKPKNKKAASYNSIFDYFNQLKVNKINLFNGSINYEAELKSKIDKFTISVADYTINPNEWKERKAVSYFKILLFNATGIEQELPDSIHSAKIDQIIYTGINNKAIVQKLALKPISGRSSYKSLKSRNTNFSAYANIKAITLTHFYPEKLVINNELATDSIIIDNPQSSIRQYPGIRITKSKKDVKKENLKFSINHLITNNGSIKLRRFENGIGQQTLLNGIYFKSNSITESLLNKKLPTDYKLLISNGSIELKNIGHTASFNNLSLNESLSILIDKAEIKPDSSTLPYNQINAKLTDVLIQGIDIETLNNQTVSIDTFSIGNLEMHSDFTRKAFVKNTTTKKNAIKSIAIGGFNLTNSNINVKQSNSIISIDKAGIDIKNIRIDSLQNSSKPIINFNNTLLNIGQFSFNNPNDSILITGNNSIYSEIDSTFTINNLHFSSAPKNLTIALDQFKIKGFDKIKLEEKQLQFRTIELFKPILNFVSINNKPDSLKTPINVNELILKGGLTKIVFDTLLIIDGTSNISLANNKMLDIRSIKGIIINNSVDTLTTIYDAANNFKGIFEFKDIYLKGLTDTLSVAKLHLDTKHRFIWTDSIHYDSHLPTNTLKIKSPGIAIDRINIPKLLDNKVLIGQISSRNNFILLTQTDTSKVATKQESNKPKIPFNITINDINFLNTTFEYTKIGQPSHLLSNLNFDIELDSLLVRKGQVFDVAKHTKDARFRTYNFSFNLPDSLNTIGFDTLLVSSGDSEINVANLTLKARYPKYEYGNVAGHQADWKDILVEKIRLENMDFVTLIENKTFKCKKITLNKGYIDLFKDKQLPFPSNRVVPMLQERIKNIKVPIKVDTIEIKNIDIFQTTLQSTGLQEGGISFINTNGLVTNLTNDSLRLVNNRLLKVVASTKIMGSGNLYAEFEFDMLNEDNLFFFDARLGPMSAKAFNNILVATAQVSVKSGDVKSLNLQATGNKSYAYGDMSFIYNNLKVETINKKTLENKGMGKVLKTFFANAFVVKKNNSRIKFISRRGGMYYERDISRISLDYMAKTALSGIVSSIGAKSNRKEIKHITKDNKADRDLEIKRQKELNKAAKKKAKKE